MSLPAVPGRLRQAVRLLGSEGVAGLMHRARRAAATRIAPPCQLQVGVSVQDFRELAAITDQTPGEALPWRPGEPLRIGFVTVPPGPGSGGHTTIFRIATALEAAGHSCTIYLRDLHGWDFDRHRATIREWWPWSTPEVRDFEAGVADAHALFATNWQTAYWVGGSQAAGARFYLVQDFEPSFYAAGSEYLLAESTYRFGFHGVTAGRWLAELLTVEYGMEADAFDLGSDLEVYQRDESPGADDLRSGVAYYCRPETPRRAHGLAMMSLELFHRGHPEVPIHFYGSPVGRLPFPAVQHGLLDPPALNRLYNRCFAGLVLSATNVSLVPLEMLAAGCVPVVNDADHNRSVLANDQVAYARATPHDLAQALSGLAMEARFRRPARSVAASRSVAGVRWADAGAVVEEIVRLHVAGQHLDGGLRAARG